MSEPTKKTLKQLFARSGNVCAFPGCQSPIIESTNVVTGEICHIEAKNCGGPRFNSSQTIKDRESFENLILLCRRHHKIIDTQVEIYKTEDLKEIKRIHESNLGRKVMSSDLNIAQKLLESYRLLIITKNSGNVTINRANLIQAEKLIVNTKSKNPKFEPARGTIGSNKVYSRYLSHLISRYNDFASKDKTRKTNFSYGAIGANIESKFGARWQLLDEDSFHEVTTYLQSRISKTTIARKNKGKGWKSFSTFEEYCLKYESKKENL